MKIQWKRVHVGLLLVRIYLCQYFADIKSILSSHKIMMMINGQTEKINQ